MKHENLVRLVEAATPEQARRITRLVLRLLGYASSRVTDGPYDGGVDFVVQAASGEDLPLGIAVSTEKKSWKAKAKKDVTKAHGNFGYTQFLVVTTRRVTPGLFRGLQTELRDVKGLHVDRIDSQELVDLVLERAALPELLESLDLDRGSTALPAQAADRRRDAAYAMAFFSPEAREFRKSVREMSILVALAHAGGALRLEEATTEACRLLGVASDEASGLVGDVDRLRAQGRIIGKNGHLELPESETKVLAALRSARDQQEGELRSRLREIVEGARLEPVDEALSALLEGLGALLVRHIGAPAALDDLRDQATRLRNELAAYGLDAGRSGEKTLERAVEIAAGSDIGQSLAMGSLYRSLTSFDRDALLRAFDAHSVSVVLDASVAIPMLCALFHGSVRQRFFLVAEELHRRARHVGLELVLPHVWLEEMASHLLLAHDYHGLVDDDDLRQSRNAYVAYYAAARAVGVGSFDSYLATFGVEPRVLARRSQDRIGARREVETFLRRQLLEYGVSVVQVGAGRRHRDAAAKDWDWACLAVGIKRHTGILVEHDKRVLAWLLEQADSAPAHAPVVVTWDRVLRQARPSSGPGGSLDPLAICEVLSFLHGGPQPPLTTQFGVLWVGERESEKGAQVLDALVGLEKENLSDAQLVRRAIAFKNKYLSEHREVTSSKVLEADWQRFRAEAETK